MLHSDQKYANFCSEWSIVGYWTVAFRDLWTSSMLHIPQRCLAHFTTFSMGSKGNSCNVLACAGMGSLRLDRCIASSSLCASGTMTSWDDVLVSFLRNLIHTAAFLSSFSHFCPRISLSCSWKPLLMIQRAPKVVVLWSYTEWRYQLLHCSTPNTHHKRWWL